MHKATTSVGTRLAGADETSALVLWLLSTLTRTHETPAKRSSAMHRLRLGIGRRGPLRIGKINLCSMHQIDHAFGVLRSNWKRHLADGAETNGRRRQGGQCVAAVSLVFCATVESVLSIIVGRRISASLRSTRSKQCPTFRYPSFRRTAHRHGASRVSRSNLLLECPRP